MTKSSRLHPQKFLLWIGIASICMLFAGLTSAYIVKKSQSNFIAFSIPTVFLYSTAVILISSATMVLAVKAFKKRNMLEYKKMLWINIILGLIFTVLQVVGFKDLIQEGIYFVGYKSNAAASFFFVIVGMHLLHLAGGIIALLALWYKTGVRRRTIVFSAVPVEMVSTYWHFLTILWIYLLIFLYWMS